MKQNKEHIKFIFCKKVMWVFVLSLLLISTSCINEWDKWLESNYIEHEIIEESNEIFKQGYIDIKLIEYNNILSVELETTLSRNFKFPKSKFDEKPLTYTNFYFIFYANGKLIKVDKKIFSSDISIISEEGNLSFISKIKDISHSNRFKFNIPMFVFHSLSNGEQEIEMVVFQKHFQNNIVFNNNLEKEFIDTSLIKGKVKFTLGVPKLYITQICNDSIILKNDKTFSPYGMDVAFLKKGLPDIYWKLDYYKSENERGFRSFSSPIQDYVTMYTQRDTVNFYHYENTEGIKLSVWDSDEFSKDDFISSRSIKFSNLKSKENEYINLEFGNITKFKIKILNDKHLIN